MTEANNVIADDLQQLANMYVLNNVLQQLQKNLTLIQQGVSGLNITVNGANLFQLAAQYYGDATKWTTIASANGLIDPEIIAGNPITLVIPSVATDSGGILNV